MKTNFSKGYHFQNSMIQVVRNAYPRPLKFLNVDFAFLQLLDSWRPSPKWSEKKKPKVLITIDDRCMIIQCWKTCVFSPIHPKSVN